MSTRTITVILSVATIIVIALAMALFLVPAPAAAPAPFSSENVRISSPLPRAKVPKSFDVMGEARGVWYFEATFPVMVRDKNENVLASTYAEAKGEWMTAEFVPFTSRITITGSYSGPATLILLKDNPSGLPENDDSVSIPIIIE